MKAPRSSIPSRPGSGELGRPWRPALLVGLGVLAGLVILQSTLPGRGLDATGPRALPDAAFALGWLGVVSLVAGGVGRKVRARLDMPAMPAVDAGLLDLALGSGVIAYGVFALGWMGYFTAPFILAWLGLLAGVTWQEWTSVLGRLPGALGDIVGALRSASLGERLLWVVGGATIGAGLTLALTPVWDYDGLMYHLQAPRLFLESGRIELLPDLWQANGPFTVEMLFSLGLVMESDVFAKILHLAYTLGLVVVTYRLGRRILGNQHGWVAPMILLGVPALPVWGASAYVDVAWAFYESLALYALVLWRQSGDDRWLGLAGMLIGLAMGTKYLALGGFLALGLWVVWAARSDGARAWASKVLRYSIPACLVAAPWYLKNLVLAGNPVYPFLWGGPGWDAGRLAASMAYLQGFGTGRTWLDFLMLPWNLYARAGRFATFVGLELPGLLFPLALLYPFFRRRGVLDGLAWVTLIRFGMWGLGSQQVRFLLPLFPALSVLAAQAMIPMDRALFRNLRQSLLIGLAGGVAVTALIVPFGLLLRFQPLGVITGAESRADFLNRVVSNFGAIQFMQASLGDEARVGMLWDGQAYYCHPTCWADADQSRWTRLMEQAGTDQERHRLLQEQGVTHLLFSGDAFLIARRDPTGRQAQAVDHFLMTFLPRWCQVIFQDDWVQLCRLVP